MNNLTILGHRGKGPTALIKGLDYQVNPVENTLEAFQAAIDEGASGFECDVACSRDGTIFVIHGTDLKKYASGGNNDGLNLD